MIRVYYQHQNPAGGYYEAEHSMPVTSMAQWNLRAQKLAAEYCLVGVRVTRTEEIKERVPTDGEAEYYARYGTEGEF